VGEYFFWYRPTQIVPDKGSVKQMCMCVIIMLWYSVEVIKVNKIC